MPNRPKTTIAPLAQAVVSFVLPFIILSRFSGDDQLGPVRALLLALAFPVVLELYSIWKNRKLSLLSVVAIGGIIVTGAISLLGLSEGWLAVRRSLPYAAISLAVIVSMVIRRPLVALLLPRIIDMPRIRAAAAERGSGRQLQRLITRASLLLAAVFMVVAVITYVVTLLVITSPTDTAAFNKEYANLRLISLAASSLPLLIGNIAVIVYLTYGVEKLTGIPSDALIKKRE